MNQGRSIGINGRIAAIAILGLSSLSHDALAQPGGFATRFVSDATWMSFSTNPDGTMGPMVGPSQCVCQIPGWPCSWGASLATIPEACWIWTAGLTPSSPADLQLAYFSKDFDLGAAPISGTMWIAVDDFAEVRVNGAIVGSTGSVTDYSAAAGAQSSLKQFDLTPFLVSGRNTIVVRAQNGPAWFAGGRCDPCTYAGNEAGVVFGGELHSAGNQNYGTCADEIAAFAPGSVDFGFARIDPLHCIATSEPIDATCMLGPPDLLFCSIGELGSVTLQFSTSIVDGPGDDVEVWGSCNAQNEPADVLASDDGVRFVSLGVFNSGESMRFDLAGTGLTRATFVRIQDLPGSAYGQGSGVDVDAICGLNVDTPVPTRRATWGRLKLRYR
jgi:hypothetical protein